MCDMVEEIISTERIIRESGMPTALGDATLAQWQGEAYAMMRAVSYVVSGGRDGSMRYNDAFEFLDREICRADSLPVSGAVVIGLLKMIKGIS
jgi:hypothetical protein